MTPEIQAGVYSLSYELPGDCAQYELFVEDIRMYARFPQGLPKGIELRSLKMKSILGK